MMALKDTVQVARRFQRAVRIDNDINAPEALEGFVCPRSSAEVLETMAGHLRETGQGAFTWTGPYGSGKSSLIIALAALLSSDSQRREQARELIGAQTAEILEDAFPSWKAGWRVVPVVGSREDPAIVIGRALEAQGIAQAPSGDRWTEAEILAALDAVLEGSASDDGGLIVFVDEMGKFLEHAAQAGGDIYLFQQIAERASRSDGRLIFVGVLHQAFEEYAHRLSREMRDEWAKIQGRFVDLAVNVAGEEQIDLLARAIEADYEPPKQIAELASTVAKTIQSQRPKASERLASVLTECAPLHPVVAALLGPISRRRFGQNQRSLFGFLNSAEPCGFQEFLARANEDKLYGPEQLWEYLKANLEPAIQASPDSHRWALAAEAVDRCEAIGGEELHSRLLKAIALIDLFKERSGLIASNDLLEACVPEATAEEVQRALEQLSAWSVILYKKYLGAYAVYAGSDFDIEQALSQALEAVYEVNLEDLKSLAGLRPVLAKRHYHETGALRWFDVDIVPVSALERRVEAFAPEEGTIGQFLLAIPTEGESEDVAQDICRGAARASKERQSVIGLSARSWKVIALARELLALEKVRQDSPELAGDAVARKEVDGRLSTVRSQLETELARSIDEAAWYIRGRIVQRLSYAELTRLASDLADGRFPEAPRIHNELVNRIKPSSTAVRAFKALLRHMVSEEGTPRLGIEGYPAEGGLYVSVLEASGLYGETEDGWRFRHPQENGDPCHLVPLWKATKAYLEEHSDRTIPASELYAFWRRPPFGVRSGIMPVLLVAFLQANRDQVAFYREGIFQARFTDLEVDYLAKVPQDIQLRWMDLSQTAQRLLSELAGVVRELDPENTLSHLAPIDVARGMVALYDGLPAWTKRTMRLSGNATKIRQLLNQASDPNKFLFDDLPATLGEEADATTAEGIQAIVRQVQEGLSELIEAYPTMLQRLQDRLLSELQVPNASPQALRELRERAENIKQLAGDFRLDAFAARLSEFEGKTENLEGVASLCANKPARDWNDADLDRATVEMADLAQRFIRAETFARVKGRSDKRHAMAVVVAKDGRPTAMLHEFEIAERDRKAINEIKRRLEASTLAGDSRDNRVLLAALAEMSAELIENERSEETDEPEERQVS